jgi:hypothetical protein
MKLELKQDGHETTTFQVLHTERISLLDDKAATQIY